MTRLTGRGEIEIFTDDVDAKGVETVRLIAIGSQIGLAEALDIVGTGVGAGEDGDPTIGMTVRKRVEEYRLDDRENGGGGTNAEGQSGESQEGKRFIATPSGESSEKEGRHEFCFCDFSILRVLMVFGPAAVDFWRGDVRLRAVC